jgi:hypothetical protein
MFIHLWRVRAASDTPWLVRRLQVVCTLWVLPAGGRLTSVYAGGENAWFSRGLCPGMALLQGRRPGDLPWLVVRRLARGWFVMRDRGLEVNIDALIEDSGTF